MVIDNYDPYLDGTVGQRMLTAAEDYISRHGVPANENWTFGVNIPVSKNSEKSKNTEILIVDEIVLNPEYKFLQQFVQDLPTRFASEGKVIQDQKKYD